MHMHSCDGANPHNITVNALKIRYISPSQSPYLVGQVQRLCGGGLVAGARAAARRRGGCLLGQPPQRQHVVVQRPCRGAGQCQLSALQGRQSDTWACRGKLRSSQAAAGQGQACNGQPAQHVHACVHCNNHKCGGLIMMLIRCLCMWHVMAISCAQASTQQPQAVPTVLAFRVTLY